MKIHASKYLGMMPRTILLMVVAAGPAGDAAGQDSLPRASATRHYEPTWDSLAQHGAAPKWYRDAVFGVYFHWGVYSVPAYGGEKYPRDMYKVNSGTYKHHCDTYGDPTEFGYHDLIPMFKAERWDPNRWAELFEDADADFAGCHRAPKTSHPKATQNQPL